MHLSGGDIGIVRKVSLVLHDVLVAVLAWLGVSSLITFGRVESRIGLLLDQGLLLLWRLFVVLLIITRISTVLNLPRSVNALLI